MSARHNARVYSPLFPTTVNSGNSTIGEDEDVPVPEYLHQITNVLPAKIFDQLAGLPHVPNEKKTKRSKEAHWYPVVDAKTKTMRTPQVLVEQVIQHIYKHAHPVKLKNLVGVEWWIHSRRLTDKMHFHFDRDEILWERDGLMVHPLVSSILYLTDTGGATLILDQRFSSQTKGLAPPLPDAAFLMEAQQNCLATFPGDLLHGVLPAGRVQARLPDLDVDDEAPEDNDPEEGEARRITLLMNWWMEELSPGSMEMLTGDLSRDDEWAYGALDRKLKWDEGKNKRARAQDPLVLGKECRQLYSYDIGMDASSSDDDDCEACSDSSEQV